MALENIGALEMAPFELAQFNFQCPNFRLQLIDSRYRSKEIVSGQVPTEICETEE